MDKRQKENLVSELHDQLEKAQGSFLVNYRGLNVETMTRLRKELKEVEAELRVIKNRLLKLASRETDTVLMEDHMEGPSAIAMIYDDAVAPARVLVNFAKQFDQLKIKCGQISGSIIDAEAIIRLAELPGKDVLLAQIFSTMQAIPSSFVRVLNSLLVKLLNVLKAIEQQKPETA